ncbi:MAG: FAD-binding protein, partial [Pseudomonadota bacterium]
ALVLATCGFGANPQMIAENIPSMKDAYYWGHEGNDGIGIQIGKALGGATKYMDAYQGLGLLSKACGEIIHPIVMFDGGMIINANGERFENEMVDVSGQGARVIAQTDGNCWAVFNDRAFQAAMKTPQMQNVERLGGVKKAATLSELAHIIGCETGPLSKTIAHVHAAALASGTDRYGRAFEPKDAPDWPLYAAKVTGAFLQTQGGLMVDGNAQVLDDSGAPLPNLFAAGGTARSISGPGPSGYLPAAGLCMAVTLGRLAGEEAARVAETFSVEQV